MNNTILNKLRRMSNVTIKDALIIEKKTGLPKKFAVPKIKVKLWG